MLLLHEFTDIFITFFRCFEFCWCFCRRIVNVLHLPFSSSSSWKCSTEIWVRFYGLWSFWFYYIKNTRWFFLLLLSSTSLRRPFVDYFWDCAALYWWLELLLLLRNSRLLIVLRIWCRIFQLLVFFWNMIEIEVRYHIEILFRSIFESEFSAYKVWTRCIT